MVCWLISMVCWLIACMFVRVRLGVCVCVCVCSVCFCGLRTPPHSFHLHPKLLLAVVQRAHRVRPAGSGLLDERDLGPQRAAPLSDVTTQPQDNQRAPGCQLLALTQLTMSSTHAQPQHDA